MSPVRALISAGALTRVAELFDLDESRLLARTAVERAAIEHLIESGRNGEAVALIELAGRMEQYRADPSSDEVSVLDLGFHEKLVELSGSPQLQRMHLTLLTQVRMCLTNMQATYDSIDERVEEHRKLADAIIAGKAEHAAKLLRAHMDDVGTFSCTTITDGSACVGPLCVCPVAGDDLAESHASAGA